MGEAAPPPRGSNRLLLLLGLGSVLLFLAGTTKGIFVDYLWFSSVNYAHIFEVMAASRALLFTGSGVGVFLFVLINLSVARSLAPRPAVTVPGADLSVAGRVVGLVIVLYAVLLGAIFGASASEQWQQVLVAVNAVPFGQAEPIFGQDIGFYVFQLPVLLFARGWLLGVLVLTMLGSLAMYALALTLGGRVRPSRAIKAHVSLLGALVLLLVAASFWLARYGILLDRLYDTGRSSFGPGFTDVTVRMPLLALMSAVSALTAMLLVVSATMRGVLLPTLGVATMAAVYLLGNGYAETVQRVQVEPNELARERPYIQNNIAGTRTAFGLDNIEEVAHPGGPEPSTQELSENPETIRNIRLWDHKPVADTYEQIQAIRRYYQFNDVDIDRYTIDGQYRQVVVAARELAPDRLALAGEAPTWVNEHLKFTHGYGIALSPVNEIADNRLPNLFVKDLPPVITKGQSTLRIDQPQIYFGEKTNQWVIANTAESEVDYASGSETKFNHYQGTGGVKLDSVWLKALFAWHFSDMNIALTDLNPDSRILFNRTIKERVHTVLPFLKLDSDPYVVVQDGRLVYVVDGYTWSNLYPYSKRVTPVLNQPKLFDRTNYVRNSVKAVVDAYDGSLSFYISDPSDPIIATWARAFPGTFKTLADMPPGLRQHLRYPEEMFKVQSDMYRIYHMQDPQIFYNKEDAYARPKEIYQNNEQDMDPYYVIMRLPGQTSAEFILMLPFTPVNKNNANAWLAGRADGDHYGKLLAFKFPNDKLVFGPSQIESRIDQDDRIADQFGKWKNSGSTIIRGNLLFVPLGDSYMYVEPIYLQSQQSKLPELTRVVVAAGERIEMEASLEESLNKVFRTTIFRPQGGVAPAPSPTPAGGAAQPTPTPRPTTPSPTPAAGATTTPGTLAELARQAQQQFNTAQDRLRTGDWAGYGEAQSQLEQTLRRMAELAGQP